jgi:hypothetical protein
MPLAGGLAPGIVGIASTGSPISLTCSSSVLKTDVPRAVVLNLISSVSQADFSA